MTFLDFRRILWAQSNEKTRTKAKKAKRSSLIFELSKTVNKSVNFMHHH